MSQSCVHFRLKRALSVSSTKDKLLHSIYHQSNSIHQSILNLYTALSLCIPFVLANPVFVFLQVLLEGLAVERKSGDDRYNGTENLARLLDVWQRSSSTWSPSIWVRIWALMHASGWWKEKHTTPAIWTFLALEVSCPRILTSSIQINFWKKPFHHVQLCRFYPLSPQRQWGDRFRTAGKARNHVHTGFGI